MIQEVKYILLKVLGRSKYKMRNNNLKKKLLKFVKFTFTFYFNRKSPQNDGVKL